MISGGTPFGRLGLLGWIRVGAALGARLYPTLLLVTLPVSIPISIVAVIGQRAGGWLAFALGFPVMALVNPIAKAATIVAVGDAVEGRRVSFGGAYRPVVARFGVVVAAAALWFAATAVGAGLLVVPGVIVLIGGQCLMGAVVLEGRGVRDGARRSWELVRPAFFWVLALFLVIEIVGGYLDTPISAVVGLFADTAGAGQWIAVILGNALVAPFANAILAVLFLDRRAAVDAPEPEAHDLADRLDAGTQ